MLSDVTSVVLLCLLLVSLATNAVLFLLLDRRQRAHAKEKQNLTEEKISLEHNLENRKMIWGNSFLLKERPCVLKSVFKDVVTDAYLALVADDSGNEFLIAIPEVNGLSLQKELEEAQNDQGLKVTILPCQNKVYYALIRVNGVVPLSV